MIEQPPHVERPAVDSAVSAWSFRGVRAMLTTNDHAMMSTTIATMTQSA